VRFEIAKNLATIKLDQAVEGLTAGLKDADARVRRATVEALSTIKTRESYKALKPIAEQGDASYYVEAAAIRGLGSIVTGSLGESKEEKVLKLLKSVLRERQGWNEVVRSGAIGALSQMKTSEDALSLILEYTAPGTPQALRLAAIRALGAISTGQTNSSLERILDRLQELSRETFFLTQVSVVIALGQMETARAIGILQALADQTPDGRVRRIAEEAVQRVQKNVGSDKAVKQLREELDQLKQANQELTQPPGEFGSESKVEGRLEGRVIGCLIAILVFLTWLKHLQQPVFLHPSYYDLYLHRKAYLPHRP
jgi:aminopeptidase N